MKIAIINGSARKGNTLAAISAFSKGAAAHEIEVINAAEVNISPCTGCGACGCVNGCVAKDDSNAVIDKIIASDMIVFASPIYWWGITAQLKTVIDKSYCKAAYLKGKKIGLILCAGAPVDDEEFGIIKSQFDCMAEYLNWDFCFFKPVAAYEKGELAGKADILAEIEKLGAEL